MQRATTPHKAISAVRPTAKPEKMDIHRSLETAAIRAEDGNQHAGRTLTTNYQDPPNQSVITNPTSPCQIVDTTAFSHHLDMPPASDQAPSSDFNLAEYLSQLPIQQPRSTAASAQFMQLSLCINTYLLPPITTAIVQTAQSYLTNEPSSLSIRGRGMEERIGRG